MVGSCLSSEPSGKEGGGEHPTAGCKATLGHCPRQHGATASACPGHAPADPAGVPTAPPLPRLSPRRSLMERIFGLALNSLQDISQINELNRHVPSLGGGLLPDATASEGNQCWRPVFPVLLHKPSQARAPFTVPRRGRAQDSPLILELNALWEETQTAGPGERWRPQKAQESWLVSGSHSQPRLHPDQRSPAWGTSDAGLSLPRWAPHWRVCTEMSHVRPGPRVAPVMTT